MLLLLFLAGFSYIILWPTFNICKEILVATLTGHTTYVVGNDESDGMYVEVDGKVRVDG